ncbi:hypothetical protein ACN47E_008045 [Coniothyrium glycines]
MSSNTRQNLRLCHRRRSSQDSFFAEGSLHQRLQQSETPGAAIEQIFAGLGVKQLDDRTLQYSLVFNDGNYLMHYEIQNIRISDGQGTSSEDDSTEYESATEDSESSNSGSVKSSTRSPEPKDLAWKLKRAIFNSVRDYRTRKLCKPIGIGLTEEAAKLSPRLASYLWAKLDIVPFVFSSETDISRDHTSLTVDEEAESMARQASKHFDSNKVVDIPYGPHHRVEVDCSGRALISDIQDYHDSVNAETTWLATLHYAEALKKKQTKIAFFNTTPQGGGVALMRHALIRYLRLLGVDCTWYNPVLRPEVFRITKDNHNILQGVAEHGERLTEEKAQQIDQWVEDNVERCHWAAGGGPLAPRERGGADVIIVDDPQMPSLVKIAKEKDPHRPVIFRSHIQVRGDLADQEDTATAEVWRWIWNHVKDCDVFVSHPVRSFVPKNVTWEKVGYLPATTDWLDGLNKTMAEWDEQYYMHEVKTLCFHKSMRQLEYPDRPYIVQIARFDPAKGIPDVLASYNELRKKYMKDTPEREIPQLVITGHSAVDDPDGTRIFDQTEDAVREKYTDIMHDIVVLRIGPSDQMLNVLMSCAKVALQLSTREGFEVKVSEAVHKGRPIIATRAGGIPLQVQHGKSGYLVATGDHNAVAKHLYDLFTDDTLYADMSAFAATHVSDEVSTVGNALSWLYLADTLANGDEIKPNGRWINDMAREKAGFPYLDGETKLPRDV